MQKYRLLLRTSIILNIILILGISIFVFIYRSKICNKIASLHSDIFSKSMYEIVMYGNSITQMGNWNCDLNRVDVKNSGILGFTTSHFVLYLNKSVIRYRPKICFLEAGINDIQVGIPLSRTFQNYISILDTLIKHNIEPVLQSTLFVCLPEDGIINLKVDSLNHFLEKSAYSRKLEYIDLNMYLSANKRLKAEYTTDGLHLNQKAYKIWANELSLTLKRKRI
jgi:lysophospholipase L1-like esterase